MEIALGDFSWRDEQLDLSIYSINICGGDSLRCDYFEI